MSPVSKLIAGTAWFFALLCLASTQWGAAIVLGVLGLAQIACSWWVHTSASAQRGRGTRDQQRANIDHATRALTVVAYVGLFLVMLVYVLAALFSAPYSDLRVLAMTQMVVLYGAWGITNLVFSGSMQAK